MNAATRPPDERPDHCPVCSAAVAGSTATDTACPRCGHLLWFVSSQVGEVTVVHLIDGPAAMMEMLDLLDNAVDHGVVGRLLIHFGSIQNISSAALGKLVKLMNRAGSVRGRLALCNLHPDLRQVLRITRLDQIFATYESEAEALESFGVGSPAH